MVSAQCYLTPTDRRVEAAIKAINRRTGGPATMTAIRGAFHFTISAPTVLRSIWRLEDAGLVYRYSMRTGYYAGPPPDRVSTRQHPLRTPEAERNYRWRMASAIPQRQTELHLLVEVGRPTEKPPRPTKRETKRADAPVQLALPIPDAA